MNKPTETNDGTSLWGHSILSNISSDLIIYQLNLHTRLNSVWEKELAEQIPASFPYTSQVIPPYISRYYQEGIVGVAFQRMAEELFRRVPVIEIDGPRAAGKTVQTQKLLDYLTINGRTATLAKGAGFIDSPDEMTTFLDPYPYLNPQIPQTIMSTRLLRWAVRQKIYTEENQSQLYSVFEPMSLDMIEFLTAMAKPDWQDKPVYDVLSDLFSHHVHEDRRLLGEDVWHILQDIIFSHLNHNYRQAQPVICDSGRVSRLYNHARYDPPTARYDDPFMMQFPHPKTWNETLENTPQLLPAEITLPLPAITIILRADQNYLLHKAATDGEKPADEIPWRVDSIRRNYHQFYESAKKYAEAFPKNAVFVPVTGVEETHQTIVSLLKQRRII